MQSTNPTSTNLSQFNAHFLLISEQIKLNVVHAAHNISAIWEERTALAQSDLCYVVSVCLQTM